MLRAVNAGLAAARIGAALALGAATLAVLWPFFKPMAWAAILAYLTWPLFRRLRARAAHPNLAAAAFTAAAALGIGVPVALLILALAEQAPALVGAVRDWLEPGGALPAWLAESSLGRRVGELLEIAPGREAAGASAWLAWAGRRLSGQLVSLAGGIARNTIVFGVMLVTLYGFYLNGERVAEVAGRLAPILFPRAPERFLERCGEAVQAVMFGLIGTALIQGLLAGIGIAVAGVPNAVALGAGTVVLSFLPGGGGALSLASAVWLAFQERFSAAIGLALWGVLVVASVDNVLRPILIGGQARIPFLLVFFGVLGGLASFGLIGLFVGPVLLSVALTLLTEFARMPELPGPASGPADADGARS